MSPSLYLKYILLINIYALFHLTTIISMFEDKEEQNAPEKIKILEKLMTEPTPSNEAKQKAQPEDKQKATEEAQEENQEEAEQIDKEKEKSFDEQKPEQEVEQEGEEESEQETEEEAEQGIEKMFLQKNKAKHKKKQMKKQKKKQKAKQKHKHKPIHKVIRKCGFSTATNRIVGGKLAKKDTYPWLGVLQVNGQFHCSVNIIDEWWVLTAAHAFLYLDKNNFSMFSIEVGNIERTKGTTYRVSKIFTQTYNPRTRQNDIALMKIKGPIKFNKRIMPICLPRKNDPQPKVGEFLKVAGWGYKEFRSGKFMKKLREVRLTLISHKECVGIYEQVRVTITRSQMCTYDESKDACQGDSGGPAIKLIKGFETLVGLISYGITCADDFPGVYTKVSHYMPWIEKTIESNK